MKLIIEGILEKDFKHIVVANYHFGNKFFIVNYYENKQYIKGAITDIGMWHIKLK